MVHSRTIALWLPLLCLLFVLPAFGQTRPPKQLKPKEIIKKHFKALGEEKTVASKTSIRFSGNADGRGNFTLDLKAPNYVRFEVNQDGAQPVSFGYSGNSAWRKTSSGEAVTLLDEPSKRLKVISDILTNRNLESTLKWLTAYAHSPEPLHGKECQVIEFRSRQRGAAVMYFDATTFLPVRLESGRDDDLIRFDFEDFRLVDGVREPFRIRFQSGNAPAVLLNVERISHTPDFTANHFFVPGSLPTGLDFPAFFKRVLSNQEVLEQRVTDYTFTRTETTREMGNDGMVSSKTVNVYEVYPLSNEEHAERLIRVNDRELAEREKQAEERRFRRFVEDFEKKKRKQEEREQRKSEEQKAREKAKSAKENEEAISSILRVSELFNPRLEILRGRPVIVCDFRPQANYKAKGGEEKNLQRLSGTIWIDEADKEIARMESWLNSNLNIAGGLIASLKEGSTLTFEQTRTAEGVWLPLSVALHGKFRFLVFGLNMSVENQYSDYKRFTTSVKDALLPENEPAEKKPVPDNR